MRLVSDPRSHDSFHSQEPTRSLQIEVCQRAGLGGSIEENPSNVLHRETRLLRIGEERRDDQKLHLTGHRHVRTVHGLRPLAPPHLWKLEDVGVARDPIVVRLRKRESTDLRQGLDVLCLGRAKDGA